MRKSGGHFALRVVALGAGSVLQSLWLGLFAREVGPSSFGLFGVIVAIGALLGAISGFGFGSYSLRLTVAEDAKETLSSMFLLRGAMASVLVVALGIGFVIQDTGTIIVIAVGLLAVFVEFVSELVQGALSGQLRHTTAAVVLISQRVLPLAGLLIGQWFDAAVAGVLAGLCLAVPVLVFVVVPYLAKPVAYLPTIAAARHFWSTSVVSNLTQFDVILTRLVADIDVAGFFAIGNRMVSPLNIVTSAMLNIFVPELTRAEAGEPRMRIFRFIRRIAIGAGIALCIVAIPVADFVIWFLGEQYRPAFPAIVAFVVAAAVSGVSRTYQAHLFAQDDAQSVTWGLVVGAVLGFFTIIVFGAAYGIVGVSFGPLVAQVAILVAFAIAARGGRFRKGD